MLLLLETLRVFVYGFIEGLDLLLQSGGICALVCQCLFNLPGLYDTSSAAHYMRGNAQPTCESGVQFRRRRVEGLFLCLQRGQRLLLPIHLLREQVRLAAQILNSLVKFFSLHALRLEELKRMAGLYPRVRLSSERQTAQ